MITHRDVLGRRQCLKHTCSFRSFHIDIATIDKRDRINRFSHQGKQRMERHVMVNHLAVLEHVLVAIGPANKHFTRSRFWVGRSLYVATVARIDIVNIHSIIKDDSVNRQVRIIAKLWIVIITRECTHICRISTKGVEFPSEFVGLHIFSRKSLRLCQGPCVGSCYIGKACYGLVKIRADNSSCIVSNNTAFIIC